MTLQELERAYLALGPNPKTAAVDGLNKRLIRAGADVSFLRSLVDERQEFFRTYFQVSLHRCPTFADKLQFVEGHFDLLHDWWHTDTLIPFLGNRPEFGLALEKAKYYVNHQLPYARRWGYVLFIPRLVRDPGKIEPLFALFHNDSVYHVATAEAWLLSFLAMCDPDRTLSYLRDCDLSYDIVGKAIQKICDSFVVSQENKERFKALRPLRRQYL